MLSSAALQVKTNKHGLESNVKHMAAGRSAVELVRILLVHFLLLTWRLPLCAYASAVPLCAEHIHMRTQVQSHRCAVAQTRSALPWAPSA